MINKELVKLNINDIVPYENNPRYNEMAVDAVKESIMQCNYISPIIVDENNVILAGHTRMKSLIDIGHKEIEVLKVTGLDEQQKTKYRLLDNKTGELAEWDFEKLADELLGVDFGEFDFEFEIGQDIESIEEQGEKTYTEKVDVPQYDIQGKDVGITDLFDDSKYQDLKFKIDNSNLSEIEKEFLRLCATRHIVFKFANIAEFYAKQDTEMQEMMEESALVIIDYENAMKNGYVKLTEELEELQDE